MKARAPRHSGVEMHIEKLVLRGFKPEDRHRIATAVERELTRLFAEGSTGSQFPRSGDAPRLDGGAFTIQQGASADTIGTQVAHKVHGALGK